MRRAGPADAEAIKALTRLAYSKWVPLIGREPKPMVADYDRAVREHLIDLWEENGKLIAMVEMVPGDGHMLVLNLATHHDHQGRGLGGKLLAHAEATARGMKLPEMQLYTNAAFAANISFYETRGYKVFRREPIAGGTVVWMKKVLG